VPAFSQSLETALHRALEYANERHHEYATLEHLLLSLLDDRDAAAVMKACSVDLDELRTRITEYLDNLDGNPTLTGRTPREKAVIHMMQRRAEMMLIDAVDDYFHYGTPGLGPALRPWRMPDWSGAKEWGQRRGAYAAQNMAYFNEVLAKRPFLAGDAFSMPDITSSFVTTMSVMPFTRTE